MQNEHNITELPTTSNIPVSNLAKLLKEKRHEREFAKQQTANTAPTAQTRITQPQKPTTSNSPQVAQTVSRYGDTVAYVSKRSISNPHNCLLFLNLN